MNCSYHPEIVSSGVCSACSRALCPGCTHQIKERGFCQDCLVEGAEMAAQLRTGTNSSGKPNTAAWLSILPGLGAIYNGQYIKAVTHFAVFAALCIMADDVHGVFGAASLVFYFYMIIDAYRSAQLLQRQRLVADTSLGGPFATDGNSPFWGILLIVLGVLFTARNMGFLSFGFVREAWPLLFIVVGGYLIYRSVTGKDQQAALR